ncbi:alpha/beta fold hydrolase [Phragmitibacter flavus]|nr:alpha/beta hydrolase [Phragmitibacter flavus]
MADLHILEMESGRKLAYAQYGDPEGVPLFYFHGWPSSRLQGALLDGIGKKRGLCVIAPDRPGIGMSDAQPGRALLDWPPLMAELADRLGYQKFHVVGVSGGGPYVLATAYALPERVLGAAVICGAPPLSEVGVEGMMWPYRTAMFIRQKAPVLLDQGLRIAGRISHQKQSGLVMRRLLATLGPQDQKALAVDDNFHVITRSFQESLRSGAAALRADGDLYSDPWGFDPAQLSKVPYFCHGALDKNIPLALVKRYIDRIPGAKLVVHEQDGHYSLPTLHAEQIMDKLLVS